MVNAIQRAEGKFVPGRITPNKAKKKISAVRKGKMGKIKSYHVEGIGWLSKSKAVALVRQGEIDAVIAHSRSGTIYLRSRPDKTVDNNFT